MYMHTSTVTGAMSASIHRRSAQHELGDYCIPASRKSWFYFENDLVVRNGKPDDHWSCIAHLSAADMLKSVVIEEKK